MANSPNPFDFSDFQSPAGGDRSNSGFNASATDFGSPVSQDVGGFDPFAGPAAPAGGDPWNEQRGDAFGSVLRGGTPQFTDSVVSPPVLWCALAGISAVAGVVLAVLGLSSIALAVAGWVASGPVAIGLLAVHTTIDTKRRAAPFYSQPGWTAVVYWSVMVVAFAGVGISAWSIAQWAGRL